MPSNVERSSLEPTSKAYQEGKAAKARELAGGHPSPSGDVKKPFGVRVKEVFVGDDAKETALYFITQTVAPRLGDAVIDILDTMFDALKDSTRTALFGDDADKHRGRLGNPSYAGGRVDYSGYSRKRKPVSRTERMRVNVHDYRFYEFQTREEATDVWYNLDGKLDADEYLTVNDFWKAARRDDMCSSVGVEMGWTDIGAEPTVTRGRDGYILDMPRARYLDLRGR